LLENVNPEIDRNGYHRYNNDQDDEQWRYLCFSAPDNIKNNSICDSNDDGSDNKRSHKEVDHGFTPCASVLIFDSKPVSDSLVAQLGILPILYIHIIHVLRQRMLAVRLLNYSKYWLTDFKKTVT
jgi:hypothetical protein